MYCRTKVVSDKISVGHSIFLQTHQISLKWVNANMARAYTILYYNSAIPINSTCAWSTIVLCQHLCCIYNYYVII